MLNRLSRKHLRHGSSTLGGEAPWGRSLVLLLDALDSLGADVAAYWHLVDLSSFAVQYRYEAYDDSDGDLDRPATIARVQRLVAQVTSIVRQ